MEKTSRGARRSFSNLGRGAGILTGALGTVGLAAAVRAVFTEMGEAQKVSAQTAAVLKSTGGVAGVTAQEVETLAEQLMNLSGVDDELIASAENLLLTFTKVRNVVGKGNDVFDRATRAALDLSVRFDKDLASSAVLVGKALNDPIKGLTALSRTGVQFSKQQRDQIKALVESGRTLEAQKVILRELQIQVGGAAAAAGRTLPQKLALLRNQALNLGATIAAKLSPQITALIDRMSAWISKAENQQQITNAVKTAASILATVFGVLKGAFEALNRVTGSTKNTVKLLLAAFVAFKTLQIIGTLSAIAGQIGLIGTRAKTSTGQVGKLQTGLVGLGKGPIIVTVIVTAIIFRKELKRSALRVGEIGHELGERFRERLGLKERETIPEFPLTPEPFTQHTAIARRTAAAIKENARILREIATAISERRRAASEAFRQLVQDRAAFAVERATATQTLADDLAALTKYNELLKRRIKGGHATLELEREQFQVQQQIADVLKQQAEQRAAARQARQFRLLGFGPEGQELVPGVKGLKRQLEAVNKIIAGSFLDTKKTSSLIAAMRKVLSGSLGAVGQEVRARIQQIIADLKAQLKQSSVDVTRWQTAGRGQFVLAGAGGRNRPIQVNVQVDGKTIARATARHNEDELGRRKKQRAHSRRTR